MATAHSMAPGMTFDSQPVDVDNFESFLDFNQMATTPTFSQPAKQQQPASRSSSITSPASATLNLSENSDDLQTPAVPSHEYDRYKQQTGLPTGSLNGLGSFRQNSQQSDGFDQGFSFSGIGLDESSFMADADLPSNSGLGMTADPNMEWDVTPSNVDNFFKVEDESFVNPSSLEEPQQQVRFFPGMHRQQAQRKQQEMLQQRQQQQIQQQQQAAQKQREQQARSHSSRRSTSNITDARTEETIARVVNQIRQSSSSVKDGSPNGSLLPQIVRMKKDEEDMDEDERLLASEEGKKLSSKERRQLRNKVSARAFRSRRKEYIGQLEGEVALKTNESNELRVQNRALMEENARSRAFIEKLLRHPAFHPFLEDLSRDPALSQSLSGQSSQQSASSMTGHVQNAMQSRKDSNQMQQNSLPMIPEQQSQPDLSGLNLTSTSEDLWASGNMGFNFNQTQIFAVTELSEPPFDVEALTGKSTEPVLPELPSESKVDYPVLDRAPAPVEPKEQLPTRPEESPATKDTKTTVTDSSEDTSDVADDPLFALYVNRPSPASAVSTPESESLFGSLEPEKVFHHFQLRVPTDADESELLATLEAAIEVMDVTCQRISQMTGLDA